MPADRNAPHSAKVKLLRSSTSRGQQPDNYDVTDVSRLPSTVVANSPSSGIIDRLLEKKSKKHRESIKQLNDELTELAFNCKTQIMSIGEELVSFLQEVDLRLDTLKDKIKQVHNVTLHDMFSLWEQVESEVKLKKEKVVEANRRMRDCETNRTNTIRSVLTKYSQLLEKISFLLPPDVHRLIHGKAAMLNQSLLANRRSLARMLLHLQEEILQQQSVFHLHWDDCLSCWKKNRITEVIDNVKQLCVNDRTQHVITAQQQSELLRDQTEQRCVVISQINPLLQDTCSISVVSDWYEQLKAVNEQINRLHADSLHHLRCSYEQMWQHQLSEVEYCKEALSALQLSETEMQDAINSQLLPYIGQVQVQDEERLAALDLHCDSLARYDFMLSRSVFAVLRGAALLWDSHDLRLRRREEEVQQQLTELRCSQLGHLRNKKIHLDDLLAGLRQACSHETLSTSLDKAVHWLQVIKDSYGPFVSDQWKVLDRLPSLFLDELLSFSSSLGSYFHLRHTYTPSQEELQKFNLTSRLSSSPGATPYPISCQDYIDSTQPFQAWLAEAESSLLNLYDTSNNTFTFTSSSSTTYSGPAFKCPTPDTKENLQHTTHLSLFPLDLLAQTLSMTRTLFLEKLEQHFHDLLTSTMVIVTDRKEAVCLDQELQMQLLNPQHIEEQIYQPRLGELQLHQQRAEIHCREVHDVLNFCKTELKMLQIFIGRKNEEFISTLSNMEKDFLSVSNSQRLEFVSSTLQDLMDQYIKRTQVCQNAFRQTVQNKVSNIRNETGKLLGSIRLFSEGGDFAPQEMKMFQRKLRDESKRICAAEQSLCAEMECIEGSSLEEVREPFDRVAEELSLWTSEVKFREKIDKIICSTRIQIRAEAANNNQQQSSISSRLKDVKSMLEDPHVCSDELCYLLISVGEELRKRCEYLDYEDQELLTLSAHPKFRKRIHSLPIAGPLPPSKPGGNVIDEPAADIIQSLNRLAVVQEKPPDTKVREKPGRSHAHRVQPKWNEIVIPRKSITTDRKFQIFGPEPEQDPQCLMSVVNFVLFKTNDLLLQTGEDFYQTERHCKFQVVPETVEPWAESIQQRLLGFQDQATELLEMSRTILGSQHCVFKDLLKEIPSILIRNHEEQRRAELIAKVNDVTENLREHLRASEEERLVNVQELRVSLKEAELQDLVSREEMRQQQLHSAISSSHQELQEFIQAYLQEFMTLLVCLAEKLIIVLDGLLTPSQFKMKLLQLPDRAATEETSQPGQTSDTGTSLPSSSRCSVEPQTTASTMTSRHITDHMNVTELKDAALERFEERCRSEMFRSETDKLKQLLSIEVWNEHWTIQIDTLTQINAIASTPAY